MFSPTDVDESNDNYYNNDDNGYNDNNKWSQDYGGSNVGEEYMTICKANHYLLIPIYLLT